MTDSPANPAGTAICGLLAAGPLPTATLAARLAIPERTARHRLYRLRQAGAVVSGSDGRHRLAAPAADLAAPLPVASITGPVPALPRPSPDHPVREAPFLRQGGHWRVRTFLAAGAFGLAVAGGVAVMVGSRRMSPAAPAPLPPASPGAFGGVGDQWGGTPWSPGRARRRPGHQAGWARPGAPTQGAVHLIRRRQP